jgi:hypothetical protein
MDAGKPQSMTVQANDQAADRLEIAMPVRQQEPA